MSSMIIPSKQNPVLSGLHRKSKSTHKGQWSEGHVGETMEGKDPRGSCAVHVFVLEDS